MTDQSTGAEPRRGSDKQGAGELDLEAIEGRAREATPGPWTTAEPTVVISTAQWPMDEGPGWHDWPNTFTAERQDGRFVSETRTHDDEGEANAAFIAHARTDIPALIEGYRTERAGRLAAEEEVRRLRGVLVAAERFHEAFFLWASERAGALMDTRSELGLAASEAYRVCEDALVSVGAANLSARARATLSKAKTQGDDQC